MRGGARVMLCCKYPVLRRSMATSLSVMTAISEDANTDQPCRNEGQVVGWAAERDGMFSCPPHLLPLITTGLARVGIL